MPREAEAGQQEQPAGSAAFPSALPPPGESLSASRAALEPGSERELTYPGM